MGLSGWTLVAAGTALIALAAGACQSPATAPDQLVVYVDTDATVTGQLATDPTISPDAALDTLRIDVTQGAAQESRIVLVAERATWPVSFGVARGGGPVVVRARLFRAAFAQPGVDESGTRTLDPPPGVTIDRVLELDPRAGVNRLGVTLTMDCMGAAPDFAGKTTCADGAHRTAAWGDAIATVSGDAPSHVGTWEGARYRACAAPADSSRVCIPGGFVVLGDPGLAGLDTLTTTDSVPLRPVRVSSFVVDRTEVTVAQIRALVAAGKADAATFAQWAQIDPDCVWDGANTGALDAYAINCVPWSVAVAVCAARGGQLPTEAQWEYAARGRGARRAFPWGDAWPTCCGASLARSVIGSDACGNGGQEPVGAHLDADVCSGIADVSLDGIVDMGGGVSEATRDVLRSYTDACWNAPGAPLDPTCTGRPDDAHTRRGGDFRDAFPNALPPRRQVYAQSGDVYEGFRCVYPVAP